MADAVEGMAKQDGTFMEALTDVVASLLSSKLLHPLNDAPLFLLFPGDGGRLLRLLRRSLLLSLHFLLSLLSLLLSNLPSPPPPPHHPRASAPPSPAECNRAGRALSRVLSAVACVPVSSRKYDLVRSLAERILDDNLRSSGSAAFQAANRAVLSAAFERTLFLLEAAVATEAALAPGDGSGGRIMGALRSRVRRWAAGAAPASASPGEGGAGGSAEKLSAEAMWLGQKMAESGAAAEAVAMWGAASGLAVLAVSAEPRLQVAFVRVCAFLFRHANSKQLEGEGIDLSSSRMALLRSWLPLLCRACCGIDTPILSSRERAEMESVLEEMIEKLSWDQQEEVLSLWLHHFTIFPDSDWPNLESCYLRWYSESRKLL